MAVLKCREGASVVRRAPVDCVFEGGDEGGMPPSGAAGDGASEGQALPDKGQTGRPMTRGRGGA